MSKNDVTGDEICTNVPTDAFREGYDRIFRKPKTIAELVLDFEEQENVTEVSDTRGSLREDS